MVDWPGWWSFGAAGPRSVLLCADKSGGHPVSGHRTPRKVGLTDVITGSPRGVSAD